MYIDDNCFMKQGFSMLEILLVMAIIGVLLAIGTAGLTTLRVNMEAQQAINEVTSNIKDTQNKAQNDTVNTTATIEQLKANVFGYQLFTALDPVSNTYGIYRQFCMKPIQPASAWNTHSSSCSSPELLKSASFSNIDVSNVNYPGPPAVISGCQTGKYGGILFENLTGNIYVFDSTGAVSSSAKCVMSITIKTTSYNYAWIIFDSANGTYTLQKPQ